jgi:hypothetical protein
VLLAPLAIRLDGELMEALVFDLLLNAQKSLLFPEREGTYEEFWLEKRQEVKGKEERIGSIKGDEKKKDLDDKKTDVHESVEKYVVTDVVEKNTAEKSVAAPLMLCENVEETAGNKRSCDQSQYWPNARKGK